MSGKNILFLFSDQHRGDWMPYRRPRGPALPLRMENIRYLMDRGTTFTRAATNSPLCVPARACLALGEDYDRCGAWTNDFCCPLDRPTLYRVLRQGGYAVSGVGKFDLHKPVMYWGEEGWIPQLEALGFTQGRENEGKGDAVWAFRHGAAGPYGKFLHDRGLMEPYCADHQRRARDPLNADAADIPPDAYADNWVTENALSQLRDLASQGSPWFLMVNFSGPHDPWDVTAEMKRVWAHTPFPLPQTYTGDRERLMGVRQNYAAMLENIDRNIGRLLEELRRLGQFEDTAVIYSADHGEMLGDRDRFFKSVPYGPSVHIPLVISGGGALPGHTCGELVQLSDLAATVAALAGLSMPAGGDSHNLLPLAAGETDLPVREYQYAALYPQRKERDEPLRGYEDYERFRKRHIPERRFSGDGDGGWRSVATKEYRYVEYVETGRQELFDLRNDPEEVRNIAKENPRLTLAFRGVIDRKSRPGY